MKVILTDDTFVSWAGHSAEYNFAIFDELARRGINCQIFAHNSVSRTKGLASKAKPTFTHTASQILPCGKILPKLVYKLIIVFFANTSHFLDLLLKITPCVDDKDLLLIGDFSPRTSIAYSLWLLYLTVLRKRLSVVVLVHSAPLYSYYRWEMLFFKILARFHRLTLAALNQAIADVCSERISLKCMAFPTPQTPHVSESSDCQGGNNSEVALAFLGLASVDKGFDVLVDEIGLLKDLTAERRVAFAVQCNIMHSTPLLEKAKRKLLDLAASNTRLKVIEGALATDEFVDVLCSADVILFPYCPEAYKYVQSGVFTQALTLGKIVIVTEGTHIASELERYGSGIVCKYGVPGAFAEAIRIVVNNIGAMREKAQRTKNVYYQIHNPKRYVDLLLELKS